MVSLPLHPQRGKKEQHNNQCSSMLGKEEYTVPSNEHQPKMFLLFSHLIDEKVASFLAYLKSWWNVVLVFGKEHANWSNISGPMIGWGWKIKFGKSIFFKM